MAPAFVSALLEIFKSSPSALVLIVLILCVFGTANNIMVTHSGKDNAALIAGALKDLKGSVDNIGTRLDKHMDDTQKIKQRLAQEEATHGLRY